LSATTANPILVEVKRGTLVESIHRGAIAIADTDGNVPFALGNIEVPVFPRSAVKLMQAIPLIESGAADAYGLDDGELAIACGSHSGEAKHLAAVRSLNGAKDLLSGTGAWVNQFARFKLFQGRTVELDAMALIVRREWATDVRALLPFEAEPFEVIEHRLHDLRGDAGGGVIVKIYTHGELWIVAPGLPPGHRR